ncbi:MAG: ATP-binding cassette domain-containing protein [Planctomycetota bacterium]
MIEVEQLTKSYGLARALKGVSFGVQKGEVVGFLGPNGAGKSTTMKILTGYLMPTSGAARVDGLDCVHDSLQVRARVGYLPESTPLYTDMRVDDYLAFVADIRGVARRDRASAIARAVSLCGLGRVTGKNIVELSKGFKQRVGLAQAIVHEPPVLILDEPTSGLDPNQIVEVRRLIERLGEEHTVVLSTHYLQEVEKTCSRVIIVRQGEIVADGTHDQLVARQPSRGLFARVRGPEAAVLGQLRELLPGDVTIESTPVAAPAGAGGRNTASEEGLLFRIDAARLPAAVDESVARLVVKNGWDLLSLQREAATLEDVFRELTLTTDAAAPMNRPAKSAAKSAGEAEEAHDA